MTKDEKSLQPAGWQPLEFKSRKQTGDLEKRILFHYSKNHCRTFCFTGCRGGEGVSTIVVNLVNYMAKKKSEHKILLADANFYNPSLDNVFGMESDRGILNCLSEETLPSEVIQKTTSPHVHFLSSGPKNKEVDMVVDQDKFLQLFEGLKKEYDIILLDSAPLLTSADALLPALAADATFLVLQALRTTKEVAIRGKNLLLENDCRIGGVLLNRGKQVIPNWMYKIL